MLFLYKFQTITCELPGKGITEKVGRIKNNFKTKVFQNCNCWMYKTHVGEKQWQIKQNTHFPLPACGDS